MALSRVSEEVNVGVLYGNRSLAAGRLAPGILFEVAGVVRAVDNAGERNKNDDPREEVNDHLSDPDTESADSQVFPDDESGVFCCFTVGPVAAQKLVLVLLAPTEDASDQEFGALAAI